MTKETIIKILQDRILILDGAMGTMIQKFRLTEEDYRGTQFADSTQQQKGNNDLLCITQPEIIKDIHRQYIEAGANIFTTNTFNANAISMEDYGLSAYVREINLSAGKLARELIEDYKRIAPDRLVLVAGSMGPTNKTASMSPDVSDPAYRAIHYMDLYAAYKEQAEALIDGGVDILLYETVFDTLNAKAGLEAATTAMREKGVDLPLMLSITLAGQGGRTLSGQTLAAFVASVQHVNLTSIGLNCSFGASEMKPYLEELARIAPHYISCHPNAGLPNSFGAYDETPETMEGHIRPFIEEGLVNIIGGCCGTTPEHIARYSALTREAKPHVPVSSPDSLWLSGLELLEVKPENNFINVGERCNVAGSKKFLRLIKEENYDEALLIARNQVENGAQVIDINMDDGLLDGVKEMTTFLNLIASEPDIARVPVMIDSSKWEVIEQGLMCTQGKSIVNSISLKEGESEFLERALRVKQLGAAVVVMAFDEKGQADVFERKIEVCERSYRLLTEKAGFNPNDIIFDPNILAIATGIEEHNGYGLDFIRAVEWIKQHLPGAKVSGGVSNLSFAFRGNNYIREAMHSVFLYHAIQKGMDMGIVNPSSFISYDDIEPSFRKLLEDVILTGNQQAVDELIVFAQQKHEELDKGKEEQNVQAWREDDVDKRLEYALIKGVGEFLDVDLAEALLKYPKAVDIIDGPLMSGMNKVGELFGAGKMFLPQVVKTARTMKKAVAILQPTIEKEKAASTATKAGKIVFATVKGDVHDIGKNIVSIVLSCNNYEVIDLGVMVPADKIVETAIREKPDFVCLSGLITPSLDEMIHVADEMEKAGLDIPLMVGGATTSKLHTALKIAPRYHSSVIHATDASQNPLIAAKMLNPETHESYVSTLQEEYDQLRQSVGTKERSLLPLQDARMKGLKIDWKSYQPVEPARLGVHQIESIPLKEVIPYINWAFFFVAWRFSSKYASVVRQSDCPSCKTAWLHSFESKEKEKAVEALKLYEDAVRMIDELLSEGYDPCRAMYGLFEASAVSADQIRLDKVTIPVLRQQQENKEGVYKSLADFIMPKEQGRTDYAGAFVVTAGIGMQERIKKYEAEGDAYSTILLQTLSDRFAEAATEYLHEKVRKEYWGYAPDEKLTTEELFKAKYQGIRPAVGYPSLPDQSLMHSLQELLNFTQIGVSVTENGAMYPTSSVSGIYIGHPQSSYFMIGRIGEDQLAEYIQERKQPEVVMRSMLLRNLE